MRDASNTETKVNRRIFVLLVTVALSFAAASTSRAETLTEVTKKLQDEVKQTTYATAFAYTNALRCRDLEFGNDLMARYWAMVQRFEFGREVLVKAMSAEMDRIGIPLMLTAVPCDRKMFEDWRGRAERGLAETTRLALLRQVLP